MYIDKKEMFEKRIISAGRRAADNLDILTEAGIPEGDAELLAFQLPEARHDLHTNKGSVFNTSMDYSSTFEIIRDGLGLISTLTNGDFEIVDEEDIISDIDVDFAVEDADDDENEGLYDEMYELYLCKWNDQAEEINKVIEGAMRALDAKYGTNIAPTGAHRIA